MAMNAKEFFGTDDKNKLTRSDYPRYAVGDPDEKGADKVLGEVFAVYLSSRQEMQKSVDKETGQVSQKKRLVHLVKLAEPIDNQDQVYIWGGYALDQVLPTLPRGTKFWAKYEGMQKRPGGRQLKDVSIVFSSDVKPVRHPYLEESSSLPADVSFP